MENPRRYGEPPFRVAVVHGGPGAGGEMAPVARHLAPCFGVLEPIQTRTSLEGQVEELATILQEHGDLPATLVGFSWGAWLSFILAARSPALVRKLILVGSGPFEQEYVAQLAETRSSRLSAEERAEFESIVATLGDPAPRGGEDRDAQLARLGALAEKTDTYDPLPDESPASDSVGARGDIFQGVWQDAAELRRSGQLLELGRQIGCPVVAIHGTSDPHPAEGVRQPLAALLPGFRFIALENCGHKPWIERQARDTFYRVLRDEVG